MIPRRLVPAAGLAASFAVLTVVHPSAQQPPYSKSPTIAYKPAAGKCLSAEQRKVNAAYNALERPTRPGDDMPLWDPEYFAGTWNVDMRTQDSVLGPGGLSTGTLTIKANASNPCLYEGTMKAEDPDGKAFTRTISATYDPNKKTFAWTEKDSRGYTILKNGPVGGELGGLFQHHFGDDPATPESTTVAGKKIKFKGVNEMSSPAYNRTDMQMSIDGAPYVSYGRMMLEKDVPAATP